MKVRKFLYSMLLILVASFFIIQPTLAITQQQLDDFASNNIMFYDPGDIDSPDAGCYKTPPHTVTGAESTKQYASKAAIIWNYFVNANIPGISDSAEVIAGILANFEQENSRFNPFDRSNSSNNSGLWHTSDYDDFIKLVEDEFGGSGIWHTTPDDATYKRAIEFELDILTSSSYNYNYMTAGGSFIDYLSFPTDKVGEAGAAAYADLFSVTAERNVYGTDPIYDPGVIKAMYDMYEKTGHTSELPYLYQQNVRRRELAKRWYNDFGGGVAAQRCATTVSGGEVTVFTDGIVGQNDFASLEGVEIYSGFTSFSGIADKASDLSESNNLRDYIVLAFDATKFENNETDVNNMFLAMKPKTVYILMPSTTPEGAELTTSLINKQAQERTEVQIITYNTGSNSASIAGAAITELKTAKNRNTEEPPAQTTVEIVGKMGENSDKLGCYDDPSTSIIETRPVKILDIDGKEISNTGIISDGYHAGAQYSFRLCEVTNISSGAAKTTGDRNDNYYTNAEYRVAINGINPRVTDKGNPYENIRYQIKSSHAVVNARVSGVFYALAADLKSNFDIDMTKVSSDSTFRSDALQDKIYKCVYSKTGRINKETDCKGYSGPAQAHWSNHEGGYAIDLNLNNLENHHKNNKKVLEYINKYYTPGTCASAAFTWSSRNDDSRWNNTTVKFLCALLKNYNLYFTVTYEPWHVAIRN